MSKSPLHPYAQDHQALFPQRLDENIEANAPVRIVSTIVDSLDLSMFDGLYKSGGRKAYHPKMMLKVVMYAYMCNVYSCRGIEERLGRDIHFMWLAGGEKPNFITINRFRNRAKKVIGQVFTALVVKLAEHGLLSLDVDYVDGTKIESRANKYTFVWYKNVERNTERLKEKVRTLLEQIDDRVAQENAALTGDVRIPSDLIPELVEEMINDLKKHSPEGN